MTLFRFFGHEETDERLMERFAARGDERAFEELYRRYASRFKGFFIRMLGVDGALADDFLQELFLRVYEARSGYQPGKRFSTWAFAMAYNLCKNEYRHREAVEGFLSRQSSSEIKECCVPPDFDTIHDRGIFDDQLKRVLAGLTDEQRAAYSLRYEEELSVREIAGILHCPEGTVKSRLYYTLKILQRELSDYNPQNN